METVKLLDKEIAQYMERLSIQQKQVVLSVVKTFAREETWWNDKAYMRAMDKRFNELRSGKVKGVTLEALEVGARQSYKSRKQINK